MLQQAVAAYMISATAGHQGPSAARPARTCAPSAARGAHLERVDAVLQIFESLSRYPDDTGSHGGPPPGGNRAGPAARGPCCGPEWIREPPDSEILSQVFRASSPGLPRPPGPVWLPGTGRPTVRVTVTVTVTVTVRVTVNRESPGPSPSHGHGTPARGVT
jgi:hypothetical protein